jgi:hypothetical protein
MGNATRRVTLVLDEDLYEFLVCYAREISRTEITPMNKGGVSEAARRLLRSQYASANLSEDMRRWLRKRIEIEKTAESPLIAVRSPSSTS